MKIAVGLSGGVDSSVTAALLKSQGHEVVGLTMELVPGQEETVADAKRVAAQLGIECHVIDLFDEYKTKIVSYIKSDYAAGRTPNPCVRCNREVKFGLFLEKAKRMGLEFDAFATGHYAILERDEETDGVWLKKGLFAEKDQAYFLSMLTQDQLKRTIFPLGAKTKDEVRAMAREMELFTHSKKESQDLCAGGYRDLISGGQGEGEFVSLSGEVLGRHKGIENYTVGQRRGLGISGPEPYYVVEIRSEENQVVVGVNDDLLAREMIIRDVNWGGGGIPDLPFRGSAKVRYRDQGKPAEIVRALEKGRYLIRFDESRRAITPGQLAVFYQDDRVVCGGFIEEAN